MSEKISRNERIRIKKAHCIAVINEMIVNGEKINFNNVSIKCKCAKTFLYNEPEIRKLVEDNREIDGNLLKTLYDSNIFSKRSLDNKIDFYLSNNFPREQYDEIYSISKKYLNNISIFKIDSKDFQMKIIYNKKEYYCYYLPVCQLTTDKIILNGINFIWKVFTLVEGNTYEQIYTCKSILEFVELLIKEK